MLQAPPTQNAWQTPPDRICLEGAEVHIWRASLDQPPDLTANFNDLLQPGESTRAARMPLPAVRRRFITARGILRLLLGVYLDEKPQGIKFAYGSQGKPRLADSSALQLYFNLSHSENLVLFAFARGGEIGIDLEYAKPIEDKDKIARRYFSEDERAAYNALPDTQKLQGFYNCWTRKEAYIKARGGGLSIPLDRFSVSLKPGEPAVLLNPVSDPEDAKHWDIRHLHPAPGYVGALAVSPTGPYTISLWDMRLDPFLKRSG